MTKLIRCQQGFSLIQTIIGIGISGIVMGAMVSMMAMQTNEQRYLSQKLAALDLQRQLTTTLADGSVCKFQLKVPGISFDATKVMPDTSVIVLDKVLAQASATSPSVAEKNKAVSVYDKFEVASVEVKNFVSEGLPNKYSAELIVTFKGDELVRSLKPIVLPLSLNTAGPDNAKTIESCTSAGAGVGACPTGYTLIGEQGTNESFCIETNPRAAGYWLIHHTCQNLTPSAHFCTDSEWGAACASQKVPNMNGAWEHTGRYSNWGDHNSNNLPLIGCSGSNLALGTYGHTSVGYNFRCCYRP